jgi:RNA polymerase sigma-70 factor (ECF subfamily)
MTAHTSPSDEELIHKAKQGSLEAFTLLYERYLPTVYNRVRFSIPEQDIEDVTQEVFIAVIKSIHSFRGEARFGTWLRTLTNRQIADYYRHRPHRQIEIELDENLPAPHHQSDSEEAMILRQSFRKLPGRYQEILFMRFSDGLQFNEIAKIKGQSLEAIKSLFRRAMEALDKQVRAGEPS